MGTDVDDWETGETVSGGASEDHEKLLPAVMIEKSLHNNKILHKTVFTYDALNRLDSIKMEWYDVVQPLLIASCIVVTGFCGML
jgi:hypothetical protein